MRYLKEAGESFDFDTGLTKSAPRIDQAKRTDVGHSLKFLRRLFGRNADIHAPKHGGAGGHHLRTNKGIFGSLSFIRDSVAPDEHQAVASEDPRIASKPHGRGKGHGSAHGLGKAHDHKKDKNELFRLSKDETKAITQANGHSCIITEYFKKHHQMISWE